MPGRDEFTITNVDPNTPDDRRRMLDLLLPREAENLYLVAALVNGTPACDLYAASSRDGRWLGVAGYTGAYQSLVPSTAEPAVVRGLTRHVARLHRPLVRLSGAGSAAWPAYAQLLELGFRPVNDPRQVFMEMSLPDGEHRPEQPHEAKVRPMGPGDVRAVADLLRHVNRPGDDAPATDDEVRRAGLNPNRVVLEDGGRIVATAATNGMGVRGFQILGVATRPDSRRRGYARAACTALIRAMRPRGAEYVVLFTHHTNAGAMTCYQRMGFRATGDFCVATLDPPGR